jgi:hypothetical protein
LGIEMKGSIVFVVFVLAGCSMHGVSEYERWTTMPTPSSWMPSSTLTLAIVDKKDHFIRTLTVLLTDDKGESCASGEWRHAEILAQQPPRNPEFMGVAAYSIEGRAFIMDLTANICDNYHELRGQISEEGVAGVYTEGGMFGGETLGRFYGVRVGNSAVPNKSLQPIARTDRAPAER